MFLYSIITYISCIFCLFQPEYSYVDGDETVPAESAKVLFPFSSISFYDHVYLELSEDDLHNNLGTDL